MDIKVLETQQWLNKTYGNVSGFGSVPEDGKTGWQTIYGLIRGLQHELGIEELVNNFGPTTARLFDEFAPSLKIGLCHNIVYIIQGGFWCKGINPVDFNGLYSENTISAIKELQKNAGLLNADGKMNSMLMNALLNMMAFVLVPGGDPLTRQIQQTLNRKYNAYFGLLPCDGIYQRDTNTAIIYGVQAELGLDTETANGNFGPTTSRLYAEHAANNGIENYPDLLILVQYVLYENTKAMFPVGFPFDGSLNFGTVTSLSLFQRFMRIDDNSQNGYPDLPTMLSLVASNGDTDRPCSAIDTSNQLNQSRIDTLKSQGIKYVGRYLTGTVGSEGIPKNLTVGEIELLFKNGMSIFPIYQDNYPTVGYYTLEQGEKDAKIAFATSANLGIPKGSIIYFAVDVDAQAADIETNIIPYFIGVRNIANSTSNFGYQPGVYGTRNVCTSVNRITGTSGSFVSNMSTGYSGNLGFSQPMDWTFDQFFEPKGGWGEGNGNVAVDKVAVSGRDNGFSKINHELSTWKLLKKIGFEPINQLIDSGKLVLEQEYTVFEIPKFVKITVTPSSETENDDNKYSIYKITNGKLEPEFSTGIDDILGMGVGSHIAQTAEEYTAGIDVGSVAIESSFSMKEASLSVVFNILEEESEGIKSTASIKITVKLHNEFYDNAMVDTVLSLLENIDIPIEKVFAATSILLVGGLVALSIAAQTDAAIITAIVFVFITSVTSVSGWIKESWNKS